jgi:hypothetical protein
MKMWMKVSIRVFCLAIVICTAAFGWSQTTEGNANGCFAQYLRVPSSSCGASMQASFAPSGLLIHHAVASRNKNHPVEIVRLKRLQPALGSERSILSQQRFLSLN